jgi:hypothetical protein
MKVSELSGDVLDYWVAKAEGLEAEIREHRGNLVFLPSEGYEYNFAPAHRWEQGGPIIERERIVIVPPTIGSESWLAIIDDTFETVHGHHPVAEIGPTPLVAAMRAYVASKFGEEVPT